MARPEAPKPRELSATTAGSSRQDHATIRRRRARLIVDRILLYVTLRCPRDTFAVRGAWSFAVWLGEMPRATRGLDMAHLGVHREPAALLREVCPHDGPEALLWNDGDVSEAGDAWTRRSRVQLRARLGSALEPFVVDIAHNVGAPGYVERLGMRLEPGMRLAVSCMSREWFVAEKCALLVTYGAHHSRLRDLFDLSEVSERFSFDGMTLRDAFHSVASGRDAERMVTRRDGYWEAALDWHRYSSVARRRWEAIVNSAPRERPARGLARAVGDVRDFVLPVLEDARSREDHEATWWPRRGWTPDARQAAGAPVQHLLPFDTERRR